MDPTKMSDPWCFSDTEVLEWCGQAAVFLKPGRVLYCGCSSARVIEGLSYNGIDAAGCQYDRETGLFVFINKTLPISLAKADKDWNRVIFCQNELSGLLKAPSELFTDQFGTPDEIFLVIFPNSDEPVLPGAACWLNALGYARNFRVDVWVDDTIFVCAFSRSLSSPKTVEMYESECWRLALSNRKRRLILHDYLQEIVALEGRIVELERRWDLFQQSRTGRVLQLLQKIRQFQLFPHGH